MGRKRIDDTSRVAAFVLLAWTVPIVATSLFATFALPAGLLAAHGLLAILMCATRNGVRPSRRGVVRGVLGGFAGFATYPAWGASIGVVGIALGLDPPPPDDSPTMASATVAVLVAAPLFEELLYRERIQSWLRSRGVAARWRIPISALLFAIPHHRPWAILGTAMVGLALAWSYERSGSIELCVGLHAGFNAFAAFDGGAARTPVLAMGVAAWLIASTWRDGPRKAEAFVAKP